VSWIIETPQGEKTTHNLAILRRLRRLVANGHLRESWTCLKIRSYKGELVATARAQDFSNCRTISVMKLKTKWLKGNQFQSNPLHTVWKTIMFPSSILTIIVKFNQNQTKELCKSKTRLVLMAIHRYPTRIQILWIFKDSLIQG
jgi:hypothetical protein